VPALSPRLLSVIGTRRDGGPSVVTLNLGVALAQLGKRTTMADFGRSDLRRLLGLFRKVEGLREFATSGRRSIERYVNPSPVPNLWIIGPGAEPNGFGPLAYPPEQRLRIMRALAAIQTDFILANLGNDLSDDAAELFSLTGAGILVLSAEPEQVLRSYQFLKTALHKTILRRLGPDSETARLLTQIERTTHSARTATIAQITGLVRHRDPDEAAVLDEICEAFTPALIVNAGRSLKDMELGDKLRVICRRYLSVGLEYLGFVYEDPAIDRAHVIEDPIVLRQPNSRAAVAMHRIAHKCIQSPTLGCARPDPALSPTHLTAPDARAFVSDRPGSLGGMLEGLLAGAAQCEVEEIGRHLAKSSELAKAPTVSGPAPAQPKAAAGAPASKRLLKTVFNPADLRALEDLIDSLDDGYFPDEKWRWKVRALSTPDRVVHHLISRGIRRDFFYRDTAGALEPAVTQP
jgi:MinD-like ATPase involved in chromosome partitioning or flagellar assembly